MKICSLTLPCQHQSLKRSLSSAFGMLQPFDGSCLSGNFQGRFVQNKKREFSFRPSKEDLPAVNPLHPAWSTITLRRTTHNIFLELHERKKMFREGNSLIFVSHQFLSLGVRLISGEGKVSVVDRQEKDTFHLTAEAASLIVLSDIVIET